MRDVDWDLVPESGLVVMTMEDVVRDELMKMADFRDTHGLFYKLTGSWIGLSGTGVRLGRGPLWMKDGLWMCKDDEDAQRRFPNHSMDVSQICLKLMA